MKIVVINLDKSVDRMNNMSNQLKELNLRYSRFSAVNGKELRNIDSHTSLLCQKLLCNKSMVGCALSHLQVLTDFLKTKDDFICVMEDDLKISSMLPDFLSTIPMIFSNVQFDIISLYCVGMCFGIELFHIKNYKVIKPIFPLTTSCYVVSRKGAETIIHLLGDKVNYHIDFSIAINNLKGTINYFSLHSPQLITTINQDSTIGTKSKSIILTTVDIMQLNFVSWLLNTPIMCIDLKHTISVYMLILLIVFLVGVCKKLYFLAVFALIEIILMKMS